MVGPSVGNADPPLWRFHNSVFRPSMESLTFLSITGWWFGTWRLWLSIFWEFHHPNWLSYVSEGWLNHQPGSLWGSEQWWFPSSTLPNLAIFQSHLSSPSFFQPISAAEGVRISSFARRSQCRDWTRLAGCPWSLHLGRRPWIASNTVASNGWSIPQKNLRFVATWIQWAIVRSESLTKRIPFRNELSTIHPRTH